MNDPLFADTAESLDSDDLFGRPGHSPGVDRPERSDDRPWTPPVDRDRAERAERVGGSDPTTDRLAVQHSTERHDFRAAEPLLVASGVTRVFGSAAGDRVANDRIDLQVRPGELVVVAGPSGAGKTTLLNLLAGLDRPTSGTVALAGRNYAECSDKQLSQLRREYIGYVFQAFGLLPMLSARENVEVPLRLLRMPAAERDGRVVEVLGEVGLAGHLDQRPYELSGGQQQRVSLARALVARPRLLLADEPTGQLDSATAGGILQLIQHLVHRLGVAAVVATHDEDLMGMADTLVQLQDGAVVAARG